MTLLHVTHPWYRLCYRTVIPQALPLVWHFGSLPVRQIFVSTFLYGHNLANSDLKLDKSQAMPSFPCFPFVSVSSSLKNSLGHSRSKACDSLVMYLVLYNLWTMFYLVLVSASYGELEMRKTARENRCQHANSPYWSNTFVFVLIGRIWFSISKSKSFSNKANPL